jgi:hypothetical protein
MKQDLKTTLYKISIFQIFSNRDKDHWISCIVNFMISMKQVLVLWTISVLKMRYNFVCMWFLTNRRTDMYKTETKRRRRGFISSSQIYNLMRFARCCYSYFGQAFQEINVKFETLGVPLEHRFTLFSVGMSWGFNKYIPVQYDGTQPQASDTLLRILHINTDFNIRFLLHFSVYNGAFLATIDTVVSSSSRFQ